MRRASVDQRLVRDQARDEFPPVGVPHQKVDALGGLKNSILAAHKRHVASPCKLSQTPLLLELQPRLDWTQLNF